MEQLKGFSSLPESIPFPIRKFLCEAVKKLAKEYRPEKIILYGSYAYGHPTPESDIDLLIVRDTDKKRVDRFVDVSRILYQPNRPVTISPMVYTPQEIEERLSLGDGFIQDILRRGCILYG
jgi:predicted nucleotidyltransferase